MVCILSSQVPAQTSTATITGQVTDPSRAVIAQASVAAINTNTSGRYEGVTNSTGSYLIPSLPPGDYRLQVEKTGFKSIVKSGIVLHVQDTVKLNFEMTLGSVSETVIVEAGSPVLTTESASVGTVVERQIVENMPLNGRSFQGLITLTPGIATVATAVNTPGQFVVNGQRNDTSYFTVDGVSANVASPVLGAVNVNGTGSTPTNSATGGFNTMVSIDALQEFRISTSSFAPEFGRSPGGQIALSSRGGTNGFHGDLFDYLRNTVLDANDWFLNLQGKPRAVVQQNDFGGVVGGPIVKNKLFFFGSYEGLRLQFPTTGVKVVPTQAARSLAAAASENGVVGYMAQFLNAYPLPDGNPATPCTSDATCFANATLSLPGKSPINATSVRVDYNINNRMTLFGRYSHAPSSLIIDDSVNTTSLKEGNDVYTAGWTWALTPSISNDVHFNYTHTTLLRASSPSRFAGSWSTIFPSGFAQPPSSYTPSQLSDYVYAVPLTSDYFDLAPGAANNDNEQRNITETISVVKGSHELKFGGDYRALYPSFNQSSFNWFNVFGQTISLAPFSANVCPVSVLPAGSSTTVPGLICGQATLSNIQRNVPQHFLFREYSFFGQDTWKVTPRLTLTYGLRWDINPSVKWTNGYPGFSVNPHGFDLSNLLTYTLNPLGTPAFPTRWGNVAPRVGLAYQLSTNPNWGRVLRVGYGIFHDTGTQVGDALSSSTPWNARYNNLGAGTTVAIVQFPITTANSAFVTPPIVPNPPTFPLSLGGDNLVDPSFNLPYVHEMNLTLEQQAGRDQSFTISYVGALGRNLIGNRVYPPTLTNPNVLGDGTVGDTLTLFGNYSSSDYHALQTKFQRRFSHGASALASYTWSHSIDDASVSGVASSALPTAATVASGLPVALLRGNSDFDVRHVFGFSLVYDIPTPPTSNAIAKAVLGHWSIDPIYHYQTAAPVDLFTGFSGALGGTAFSQRPNLIAGVPIYVTGSNCLAQETDCPGGKALNTAIVSAAAAASAGCQAPTATNAKGAFCTPLPSGTQSVSGNLARNAVRAFPLQELDFSVHREFPIRESIRLRFQADMFNLFNHPSFGPVDGTLSDSLFGAPSAMANNALATSVGLGAGFNPIFSIGAPRNFQFSLKLFF
ncbi:MAG: TonB-dependent receptor [Terriglobales bacterium]